MTTNYHTPLTTGAGATAANLNTVFAALDSALSNLINGAAAMTQFNLGAAAAVTISDGAITAAAANLEIATEAGAASDDLDTIGGAADGLIIVVSAADGAKTVVLKHNTGNIYLAGGADISLDDANKAVLLIARGGYWRDMAGQMFSTAGAKAFITAAISIITGSEKAISWDGHLYDTGVFFLGFDSHQMTIPTTGRYVICAGIGFIANATGYRRIRIKKNGSTIIAEQSTGAALDGSMQTGLSVTAIVQAVAGDYFEVYATQTSGGNLRVDGDGSFFSVERLS